MKAQKENNIAYIDGANLHSGMRSFGFELDYKKFRIWLKDKFDISTAYIFLGNIPKYSSLYAHLQEAGFILIFKEVIYDSTGKPKGNCDADLVLKATQDYYENKFNKALLVSSDGDYASLVSFLLYKNRILGVLSPANEEKCSILIKRTIVKIYYISEQINILRK